MVAFIASIFRFVWALVVDPVLCYLSPKQARNCKYAHPDRQKPDPKHFPYYFQNAQGLWLRWAEWKPEGEPRGVIFLVGGLGEHTGRYDSVARRFTDAGFHVFSHDHQGQGLSEGERKHVERLAHFVDDLQQFIAERLDANDGALRSKRRFILGHSMGGLITIRLMMRNPLAFNGVVLSAPALVPDPSITIVHKTLAYALGDILPKLGFDSLPIALLSRNRQVREQFEQDPAVPKNWLRARWGAEMLRNMDLVWADPASLSFPFLVIHGSKDRYVPLAASERLMQEAESSDKRIAVYDDAYHEMFTDDAICERVFADVFRFVESYMPKTADT